LIKDEKTEEKRGNLGRNKKLRGHLVEGKTRRREY
jgi:hypothetical protein